MDDFINTLKSFRQTASDNLAGHQDNLDKANVAVALETPAVAEWTDFVAVIDAEIAKFTPQVAPPG